jgi:acetyl esterase/lipase
MLIQASDSEILRDDSCRVFVRAKTAGVDATLQLWPGVPHCWQVFAPILPEGRQALRTASRFIAARLGDETGDDVTLFHS